MLTLHNLYHGGIIMKYKIAIRGRYSPTSALQYRYTKSYPTEMSAISAANGLYDKYFSGRDRFFNIPAIDLEFFIFSCEEGFDYFTFTTAVKNMPYRSFELSEFHNHGEKLAEESGVLFLP